MNAIMAVVFCVSLYHLATGCTRDELVLIQMISNHGNTAPLELYPTDPNPQIFWKEGLGELTKLGKFQSFVLGCYLRARYNGFITSDPTEVEVRSASSNACVMSALSEISSLYAPNLWHEIVLNFPWQPIMVHYNPPHEDKVFSSSYCPASEQEYRLNLQSSEVQQLLLQNKDLLDYWSLYSGWDIKDWDAVRSLYSILKTERAHNLTVPHWAQQYWQQMHFMAKKFYEWRSKTKLLHRLRGGPLVKSVIDKMLEKAAGTIPQKKVFLYTTDEDNLASFLSSLSLFNGEEPPPCATVVVELYNHAHQYYVRMLYLNSTTPEVEPQFLHLMNLAGCTEFCPLNYVVEYARDIIPSNRDKECKL